MELLFMVVGFCSVMKRIIMWDCFGVWFLLAWFVLKKERLDYYEEGFIFFIFFVGIKGSKIGVGCRGWGDTSHTS